MFHQKKLAKLNWMILFIAHFYLLVDASNGFLLNSFGTSFGISVIYKAILIGLVLTAIFFENKNIFFTYISLIFALLIGPLYGFLKFSDVAMLGFDISMILKIVGMAIFFTYFYNMMLISPAYMSKKIHSIILFNYGVILVNFTLAIMGFGFPAYGHGGDEEFHVGFKGFFYAANELSPVLFVITAYLMQYYFLKNKRAYYLVFSLSFICAALMLTKTGILSCIILLIGIPVLHEKERLFKMTYIKAFLFSLLILFIIITVVNFEEILVSAGIYQKIMFFYEKDGLLGVIFSARDKYASQITTIFVQNFGLFGHVFGIGAAGVEQYLAKYSAEIDLYDIYIWYGVLGIIIYFMTLFFPLIRASQIFSKDGYTMVSVTILTSIVLFFVSLAAGHVLTSGMLGMLWGMISARGLVNINTLKNAK